MKAFFHERESCFPRKIVPALEIWRFLSNFASFYQLRFDRKPRNKENVCVEAYNVHSLILLHNESVDHSNFSKKIAKKGPTRKNK